MSARIGRRIQLSVLLVLCSLSACSSDADPATTSAGSATTAGAADTAATSDPGAGDSTTVAVQGDPSAAVSLTGQQVCDLVPGELVGGTLGLAITGVSGSEDGTPQCAYSFSSGSGGIDNITVAAQRTEEDLGGLTGSTAYDYVVDINRTLSSGAPMTETVIDAGTQAILLAGPGLSFGVIETGARIVAIILPPSVSDTVGITAMMVAVAQALG